MKTYFRMPSKIDPSNRYFEQFTTTERLDQSCLAYVDAVDFN